MPCVSYFYGSFQYMSHVALNAYHNAQINPIDFNFCFFHENCNSSEISYVKLELNEYLLLVKFGNAMAIEDFIVLASICRWQIIGIMFE